MSETAGSHTGASSAAGSASPLMAALRSPFGGLGIGAAMVLPHALLPATGALAVAAVLMGIVAGVYVGFAAIHGTDAAQLVEVLGALCFGVVAVLGLTLTRWMIPLAYVAHAGWDAAHHRRSPALAPVPRWYISWCAAIDLSVAAGLAAIWMIRQ